MIEPQSGMMASLVESINTLKLFATAKIGPLPDSGDALVVFPSGSGSDTVYYDRHILNETEWTFQCRHEVPLTAYDTLYAVCNHLRRLDYPQHGAGADLIRTEIVTYPQLDNGLNEEQNIYRAVIRCSIYF